jgi:hypothetical protein
MEEDAREKREEIEDRNGRRHWKEGSRVSEYKKTPD